jgi:hypothetical protein
MSAEHGFEALTEERVTMGEKEGDRQKASFS